MGWVTTARPRDLLTLGSGPVMLGNQHSQVASGISKWCHQGMSQDCEQSEEDGKGGTVRGQGHGKHRVQADVQVR